MLRNAKCFQMMEKPIIVLVDPVTGLRWDRATRGSMKALAAMTYPENRERPALFLW
jgi:hypothetical protein